LRPCPFPPKENYPTLPKDAIAAALAYAADLARDRIVPITV
jgi:uncharacterized protein (DUF433 family)